MASACTSLLLRSKPAQRNYLHFCRKAGQILCDFSGIAEHCPAHLDNNHKRISLTVGSKKSKNVKLESKVSSEPFPNTSSIIL